MKPKPIILMALVCLLLVGAGNAQNMSISEMGYTGPQTVQIYSANSTLLGTYNTTSNGIALPEGDFLLVVKPDLANKDASDQLADFMTFLTANLWSIVFFFAGIFVMTRRW